MRTHGSVGEPTATLAHRAGQVQRWNGEPKPAHRDDPAVETLSTVDAVGMRMGTNCGLTVLLMPTGGHLWFLSAQVQ